MAWSDEEIEEIECTLNLLQQRHLLAQANRLALTLLEIEIDDFLFCKYLNSIKLAPTNAEWYKIIEEEG